MRADIDPRRMGIGRPADKWGSTAPFPHAPHGASRSATLKLDPQNLWFYPRQWPNAPRGYLFLVPAAERVAAKLFGDAWNSDGFLLEEYTLPTDMLAAPPETRAYAHSIMPRIYGESYQPDYENAALGPLGGIAALGGSYAGLGTPQGLFRLGDPPAREEGYWFTEQQWADAQAYLHAVNLKIRPRVEMAREVSRWLSEEIADGAVRTFLFRLDEQDQREGAASDWQFMDIEKRRRRFRHCTMMPGKPASQSGSHVIFIHAADLQAALERDEPSPPPLLPAEPAPLEMPPSTSAPVEISADVDGRPTEVVSNDAGASESPDLEAEYQERVRTWPSDCPPPSRADDEATFAGRAKRDHVREMRAKFAPESWKNSGRRRKH